MDNHECPYCEKPQEFCNDEGFRQDEAWDEECNDCGKLYRLTGWYEENYSAARADCLNGGEHDYRQRAGAPAHHFKDKYECRACGDKITRTEAP